MRIDSFSGDRDRCSTDWWDTIYGVCIRENQFLREINDENHVSARQKEETNRRDLIAEVNPNYARQIETTQMELTTEIITKDSETIDEETE